MQMKVFLHQIYECKKGVRNMALCTLSKQYEEHVKHKLTSNQIEFEIQYVGKDKLNVFFGDKSCIDVVRRFIHKPLNKLTPEEDFILGIMLGYDICGQCKRYCNKLDGSTYLMKAV